MTHRPRLPLALVALVALAPAAARAEHQNCSFGNDVAPSSPGANDTVLPATGAFDVPRDTLLWVGDANNTFGSITLVELVGGAERLVPLTERGRIRDLRGSVWVLGSPVVLRPSTVHRLYTCYQDFCQSQLTEFTTGPDLGAPAPAAPKLKHSVAGSDKDDAFVEVTLDQGGLVVADDPDGDLEPASLEGRAGLVIAAPKGEFAMVESCDTWPLAKSGGQLRFGVYTLSGAFSGWSEPATFDVPYYGCALAPSGPAALLVLPLLLRRRRRAR